MAAKRKAPSGTNQKRKKQAVLASVQNVLVHPKPVYPADEDRREVLWKNIKQVGCGLLMDLPWRYTSDELLKEIVLRKPLFAFANSIQADPDLWTDKRLSLS
jgi:hypothetical protein